MAAYGVETSNISGEGDDGLLSTYSMLSPTPFTGMVDFKESVMSCLKGFIVGSPRHHQYMAFMDVNLKCFNEIDAVREGPSSLPRMIVLYDAIQEVIIVKLMPSLHHGSIVGQFNRLLLLKFIQFGVHMNINPVGSARFGGANETCKEADIAYRPLAWHCAAFPSLVVEVGLSESLSMLRNDATYWLTKSHDQTQVVIVIHVDIQARSILIQRWECVINGRPHDYPPIPGIIQSLELVHGQEYVGADLEIPAAKVLDPVPNHLCNGEFRFICNELQAFSDYFWSAL